MLFGIKIESDNGQSKKNIKCKKHISFIKKKTIFTYDHREQYVL